MSSDMSVLLLLPANTSHQAQVLKYLEKISDVKSNSPDLHFVNALPVDSSEEKNETDRSWSSIIDSEPLTIERVRDLTQEMALSPYQEKYSTFVILRIDSASLPAQNALLKAVEEPPAHVRLILTTSRMEQVLPTIQSRCVVVQIPESNVTTKTAGESTKKIPEDPIKTEAKQIYNLLFLGNQTARTGKYSAAITLAEKYKDREPALQLVQDLLLFVHRQNQQQPQTKNVQVLQRLIATQSMLEKNVNVRLAMEELFFPV